MGSVDGARGGRDWECGTDRRPTPQRRFGLEGATERIKPIFHIHQTGTSRGGAHVKSASIVGDLDPNMTRVLMQAHSDVRRGRVLLHILECFQGAEVESCFGLLRVPTDAIGIYAHRARCFACLRA